MPTSEDYSPILFTINELVEKHGPLDDVDSPTLPDDLRTEADKIRDRLLAPQSLTTVELILIARLFFWQPHDYCRSGTVLKKLLASDVPQSAQYELLRRLSQREILRTLCPAYHVTSRNPLEVERCISLTDFHDEPLFLSEKVIAAIIGDAENMKTEPKGGYADNCEFLESWRPVIEAMPMSWQQVDFAMPCRGSMMEVLFQATRQLIEIRRRLDLTSFDIPFRKFCVDFELNEREQMAVIYDVWFYDDDRTFASDLNTSILLTVCDAPFFMARQIFGKESRLVKNQIYIPSSVTEKGVRRRRYELLRLSYTAIMGQAVLKKNEPVSQ